jgi:predicted RNA-binding protein YlqC (UPF0109 family)
MDIKATLQFIVSSILPPESIFSIDSEETSFNTVYRINIAPELAGLVIGKEGRIIKSIRQVMGGSDKPYTIQINSAQSTPSVPTS